MNYLGTEHLIIYAFLFVTLLIGLWAGRDIKDIREYAIANKMYGTGVLTITFLATYLGGSNTLGVQNTILSYGLVAGVIVLGSAVMLVYTAQLIVPKMMRFNQSITLGDLMKELYGPYGGIITGIMGTFYTISLVGVQILAVGHICERLLGWPTSWSIGVGGLTLIFYSSFGGVKSVTITDIFQFIVFVMVIPLIANLAVSEVGGVQALLAKVPADKLTIYGHEKFPRYLILFMVWCLFPANLSSPPIVQRILMVRHEDQAKHMLFISAAFILVVRVLLLLTCLSVIVLAPGLKPSSGGAFIYIIQQYFSPVLKGLCVCGILAVIMSTLDSFLNAGGLLLTHNVLKPSFDSMGLAFDELKNVRYITFLMGCAGVVVAFSFKGVLALSYYGMSIFAPVITIPLVAGILGLKTDTRTFLFAFLFTTITFVLANLLLSPNVKYLVFPISVVANTASFLGMHILRYGGIVVVKHNQDDGEQYRSYRYTYETKQVVFALFICFSYMIPYFMYTRVAETTMFGIKFVGIMLCVGLLLKPYWPAGFKKYFDTYWHFCLLYCLPFTTTVLYLLNGGGLEWTVNIALSIMLLLNLVDWKRFVVLLLTGIVLGVLYVRPDSLSYENTHMLVYSITFSTLVGLLFARRKEQHITQERRFLKGQGEAQQANLRQSISENRKVLQALQNTGAGNLLTMIRSLHELDVKKADSAKLEALERELIPIAFQLQGIDTRSQDYLRLHIQADRPVEELLSAVKEKLRASGIQASVKIINEAQRQTITGDFEQLVTLLQKSIALLQGVFKEDGEEPIILISLKDTQLSYPLPDIAKSYIKHVPALRIAMTTTEQLPAPAPSYSPDLNGSGQMPSETTQDLDRVANARIIKAHYGYAEMTDDTLLYVVPTDVREVRPRDMDKAYMEVDATPKRANDHFVGNRVDAQTQEAAFLTDVATRSDADLGLIKIALELIKWYHGPSERKSGEPFYLHPLTVAHIVLSYDQDEATIIGALLHDTVEDTPMLLQHIETVFGKDTAEAVDLVTHLQSIEGSIYKIKMSASENLQMLDRAGNKRGLFVKIADRMHNMRTINGHSKVSKRKLIAQETADFFVPLAKKLGLQEAAAEFERLCEEVFKQKD